MATTILTLPIPLLLLINLHILEYPHANNPEYDHAIFDPHVRGLKERIKLLEDIAYFLVAKIEGTAKGILGTYPCHTPSDSLAFRTSLAKYLEALRHSCIYPTSSKINSGARGGPTLAPVKKENLKAKSNSGLGSGKEPQANDRPSSLGLGWWWKDIVVRKSLLEECSGERFERLLLSISTHALALSVSKSKRSAFNSFELLEPQTALPTHLTTYFTLLAQTKAARHAWARTASVLIQREAELHALKNHLTSKSHLTTGTKYSALATPALIAFVHSKRQDLLRVWARARLGFESESDGHLHVHRLENGHRTGKEVLALEFLEKALGVEQLIDEAQSLGLQGQDQDRGQDRHQPQPQSRLEILPLPLPIAAAHHPTHLKKLRKPIFPSPSLGRGHSHPHAAAAFASLSSSMNASTSMPAQAAAPAPARGHASEMYLSEQYGPALKQMHAALGDALSRIMNSRTKLELELELEVRERERAQERTREPHCGDGAVAVFKATKKAGAHLDAKAGVKVKPGVNGPGKGRGKPVLGGKASVGVGVSVSGKTNGIGNTSAHGSSFRSANVNVNANAKKGSNTRAVSGKPSSSGNVRVGVGVGVVVRKVPGTSVDKNPKAKPTSRLAITTTAATENTNIKITNANANGTVKDACSRSRIQGVGPRIGKARPVAAAGKSPAPAPPEIPAGLQVGHGTALGPGPNSLVVPAPAPATKPKPKRTSEDQVRFELGLDLWEPSTEIIKVDFSTKPTPALLASFNSRSANSGAGFQVGEGEEKTLEQRIDEIRGKMLPAYPPVPDVSAVVRLPYAKLGSEVYAGAGTAYGAGKSSKSSRIPRVGVVPVGTGHGAKRDGGGEKQRIQAGETEKSKSKSRKSIRLSLAAHAQRRPSPFGLVDPSCRDSDDNDDGDGDHAVTKMIDAIHMHSTSSPPSPPISSNTDITTSTTLEPDSANLKTYRTQQGNAIVKINRIFTSTSKPPKLGRGVPKESGAFPNAWVERPALLPSFEFESEGGDESDADGADTGEKSMTLKEILLGADVSVTGYALLGGLRAEDCGNGEDGAGIGEESFEWE